MAKFKRGPINATTLSLKKKRESLKNNVPRPRLQTKSIQTLNQELE